MDKEETKELLERFSRLLLRRFVDAMELSNESPPQIIPSEQSEKNRILSWAGNNIEIVRNEILSGYTS